MALRPSGVVPHIHGIDSRISWSAERYACPMMTLLHGNAFRITGLLCEGIPPVTGKISVMWNGGVLFVVKLLNKQSFFRWFETPWCTCHIINKKKTHKRCPQVLLTYKPCLLTYWGREKMAAISQTVFSNAFSWMKNFEFQIIFHRNVFLSV